MHLLHCCFVVTAIYTCYGQQTTGPLWDGGSIPHEHLSDSDIFGVINAAIAQIPGLKEMLESEWHQEFQSHVREKRDTNATTFILNETTTQSTKPPSTTSTPVNWDPFIPAQYLQSKCHVAATVNSPQEYDGVPTPLNVSLGIDRFVMIDDVGEQFIGTGIIVNTWLVPCIARAARMSDFPKSMTLMPRMADGPTYWVPSFIHRNSLVDTLMKNDFDNYLNLFPMFGLFLQVTVGRFTSYCDLNLYRFPFDYQVCHIRLTVAVPNKFIKVQHAGFFSGLTENFMGPNAGWQFLKSIATSEPVIIPPLGTMDGIKFSFYFRRKPDYYLYTLLVPSFVLCILQIAMFLLPPEGPDRASYAVTVLMSFFVLQSQIWDAVPHTPQPLLVTFYAIADMFFSMLCVLYAGGICLAIYLFPHIKLRRVELPIIRRNGKVLSYKYHQFVDTIAFICYSLAYIFINAMVFGFTIADPSADAFNALTRED